MSLTNLTSAQLSQIMGLIKEKEDLLKKLELIDGTLAALESGNVPAKKRGRKPGRPAPVVVVKEAEDKGGKRGKRLKGPLLKVLADAGSEGITVKDLAAKLKVKPGNVFSWFYTTGKKIKGINKVGEAKYAYSA